MKKNKKTIKVYKPCPRPDIDFLYIKDGENAHFCVIENLSRLISSSKSKHKRKGEICRNCN